MNTCESLEMEQHDAFILQNTAIYRDELIRLLTQRFTAPGAYETAIAPLQVIRLDAPSEIIHTVHKPALCLIVQGQKEVGLGDDRYLYDPLNYLVVSVTLPVSGRVLMASPEAPYLCIRFDFEATEIAQVIADAPRRACRTSRSLAFSLKKSTCRCWKQCFAWYGCWRRRRTSACWLRSPCESCITASCGACTDAACMSLHSVIRKRVG